MIDDRALRINSTLVDAYMVRERLKPGRPPDVTWFTSSEATEASIQVSTTRLGRRQNADGSTTYICFVEPTRSRALYTWALAAWADGGAP